MIIVDTGPLYAAADTSDSHHMACVTAFEETREQLAVPVSVVIETCFLIERHLGPLADIGTDC
jgi:predicted nucleic acid-binding protein